MFDIGRSLVTWRLSNSSGDNNVAYSSLMEIRRNRNFNRREDKCTVFVQQNPDTNQVIFFANNEILKIHCRRGNSWKGTDQSEQGIVNKLDFILFSITLVIHIFFYKLLTNISERKNIYFDKLSGQKIMKNVRVINAYIINLFYSPSFKFPFSSNIPK